MKTILIILSLVLFSCQPKFDKDKQTTSITDWVYLDDSVNVKVTDKILYVYDENMINIVDTFYFKRGGLVFKATFNESSKSRTAGAIKFFK